MRRALALVLSVMLLTPVVQAQDSTPIKRWATTFVYGVVPSTVASAALQCRDGLAKVRRGESPANTLISIVTLGMFTPITILVTCAAASEKPLIALPAGSSFDEVRNALADAVDESLKIHRPVVVRFGVGYTAG